MNLIELQRRMAENVRRPLTSDYEMQRTVEDGTSTEEIAAGHISPNARLSSFERLEIYNRQYWFRLVSVVSEDFPMLNAVIGTKRFDALILTYLQENPSTTWTLRDLGAKLPAFLEIHPEFSGRRHRVAVDVARLEWAYVDAFDSKQLVCRSQPRKPKQSARNRNSLCNHISNCLNWHIRSTALCSR
ncbi:MAG: DNA-binding domain-containing protein [Acidobacteriaceae bacterium]